MLIIHHVDDDGLCAASIVATSIRQFTDTIHLIPYNYDVEIDLNDIRLRDNEEIYIVDLALNEELLRVIKELKATGHDRIVHIDHHKSTFDMMNKLNDEDRRVMSTITTFYKIGISGCMLTYIYLSMNNEERKHPMDFNIEFGDDEKRDSLIIKGANHAIPMAIRLIDDYDVHRLQYEVTDHWHAGFASEIKKTDPMSNIWGPLVFDSPAVSNAMVNKYIERGKTIELYLEAKNQEQLKKAFVMENICGDNCKTLCLNSTSSGSKTFGDEIDKFDACCLYCFNGETGLWEYHFYSGEECVDVTKAYARLGVRGHAHAGGCTKTFNIFDI